MPRAGAHTGVGYVPRLRPSGWDVFGAVLLLIGFGWKEMRMRFMGLSHARRVALLGAVAVVLLLPVAGQALSVGGQVIEPLYFGGDAVRGFDPVAVGNAGLSPTLMIDLSDPIVEMLSIGVAGDLLIELPPSVQVFNNPQGRNPPESPNVSMPFYAVSNWTVTNTSGDVLEDVILAWTMSDPMGTYPDVPIGMNSELFTILSLVNNGSTTLYGAVDLGTLATGDQRTVQVGYIVAGNLPLDDMQMNLVMPPLGVAAVNVVPEPSTLLMMFLGLAGLARSGRR